MINRLTYCKKALYLLAIVFISLLSPITCLSQIADASKPPKLKPKKKARYVVPKSDTLSVASSYAQFMEVPDNYLFSQLYSTIDEWIGTPYRYGRNSKKTGTDCSGFVGKVFQELFNTNLPRSAAGMANAILPKSKDELQEGDLIIFNYYRRHNSHVGIYLQNGWFVHASNVYGVTLANLNTAFYQQKISKCGTIKGLNIQQLIINEKRKELEEIKKLPVLTPTVFN